MTQKEEELLVERIKGYVTANLPLSQMKDEELEELARREAFEQEMREFALELVGGVIGQSTDWEALGQAGEEAQ